jgi:hypothetical protein
MTAVSLKRPHTLTLRVEFLMILINKLIKFYFKRKIVMSICVLISISLRAKGWHLIQKTFSQGRIIY